MSYIVDTHIFLWSIFSPKKITKNIREILLDPQAVKVVSAVTFWEISLKYKLGKIDLVGILPDRFPKIAKDTGFEILDLESDTASTFYKLPQLKNKDPFDRMLAWQTITCDCYLLTQDADFADYGKYGLKTVTSKDAS